MNPEDDPEARIRQLEQPLADTARASELGGTQPPRGYPYPPSPYGYTAPFAGATPKSSTGMRVFWIMAAFFVVGVLTLVGGIAAVVAHRLPHGTFVVPSSPPTTGRGASPSSAQPSTSPLPPPGGRLGISGINENKTIACNDSNVSVSGVSNTVVITGHCVSLTVSGVNNSVTVDAVDTIAASGFNNRVTYHSGSPKVTKAGDSNVVQPG